MPRTRRVGGAVVALAWFVGLTPPAIAQASGHPTCHRDRTACCGDGRIEGKEQCDGSDLGGATCASLGYTLDGTLGCTAGCGYDTSGCKSQAFPATGQTTCWDSSGNVIPCAGRGQDGDIQAGAPLSYTDNGDGTITDDNTGLMWEKQSQDLSIHDVRNTYTWDRAFDVHVAGLNGMNFAGHRDWRVPNVKELQSIVNYGNQFPAVSLAFNTNCTSGCTVRTCSCTAIRDPESPASGYWSSTTSAGGPGNALFVGFGDGFLTSDNKAFGFFVRAVRGGS